MFNKKINLLLAAAAIAAPPAALAQAGPPLVSSVERLTKINESKALLAAELAELDLQAKVQAKKAELKANGIEGSNSADDESLPVVVGIEGIDGKLQARLAFGNGLQQVVKQGGKIRGGWTISKITSDSVLLAKGGKDAILHFGSEPPSNYAAANAGGPGGGIIGPYGAPAGPVGVRPPGLGPIGAPGNAPR